MELTDVVERFRDVLGERTGLRAEMQPVLDITRDPVIELQYLPPAVRRSRENDEGNGLLSFLELHCVVYLTARGSGAKAFRRALAAASQKINGVFDTELEGGDFPLGVDDRWHAAYEGMHRPGEPLTKDEDTEGSFSWNEAWDVLMFIPELALA